jgi:hypothetical protein
MTLSPPPGPITTQLGQQGLGQQPWWVEQWMELINSYRYKKRLERAWDYARSGNVLLISRQQRVIGGGGWQEAHPQDATPRNERSSQKRLKLNDGAIKQEFDESIVQDRSQSGRTS